MKAAPPKKTRQEHRACRRRLTPGLRFVRLSPWVVPDTTVRPGVPRKIGSAVAFATKTAGEGVADGVSVMLVVGVADDALVGVRVEVATAGGAATAGCVAAGGATGAASAGQTCRRL